MTMQSAFTILLFAVAIVDFCCAQIVVEEHGEFSAQDGFVFPGESKRPDRFPLNKEPITPELPILRPLEKSDDTQQIPQDKLWPFNDQIEVTPAPPASTTASTVNYNECIGQCPTTSEYNPVCGSDNTVYSNPGKLNCAVSCGRDIRFINFGPCQQL